MISENWSIENSELIVCERCAHQYFANVANCNLLRCPKCNGVAKTVFSYMDAFPYGAPVNPDGYEAKGVIVSKYNEEGQLIHECFGFPSRKKSVNLKGLASKPS